MTQLRIWNQVNSEGITFRDVQDIPTAIRTVKDMAMQQLMDKSIICNVFGLEVWDDEIGDYVEWYDDDDNDICALAFPEDVDDEATAEDLELFGLYVNRLMYRHPGLTRSKAEAMVMPEDGNWLGKGQELGLEA